MICKFTVFCGNSNMSMNYTILYYILYDAIRGNYLKTPPNSL